MPADPPQAHLSDEQLSGHLDGESGAPAATHLEECGPCRARLAALGGARAALRTPLRPLDPLQRAAAIAAVLEAAEAGAGGPSAPTSVVGPWGRRRWMAGVGAAAALVVLVAGLTVAALHGSAPSSTASSAARHGAAASGQAPTTTPGGRLSFVGPGNLSVTSIATRAVRALGDVQSAQELRAAAAPAPAPSNAAVPSSVPASGKAASAPAVPPSQDQNATTTPSSIPAAVFGPVVPADQSAFERCLDAWAATGATRGLGPVQELATATYRGTPALVYVLAPSGDVRGEVVALARSSCRQLARLEL